MATGHEKNLVKRLVKKQPRLEKLTRDIGDPDVIWDELVFLCRNFRTAEGELE